ncbi:MAG: class I SAM-dependent methyltransferase [Okeania sp. SIO2D1]|nr:class I SAM-dependent methyltransferase [Okeania sp. SIO2D1]
MFSRFPLCWSFYFFKLLKLILCGLGDDAEALADEGFQVSAFDISPSAIAWCERRFPRSRVNYLVADLFAADQAWQHKFELVFECRNIQALPLKVRPQAIAAIASWVAPGGTLVAVTRYRDQETEPDGPPWPLSEGELRQFDQLGLQEIRRATFLEGQEEKVKQLRLEYRRELKLT